MSQHDSDYKTWILVAAGIVVGNIMLEKSLLEKIRNLKGPKHDQVGSGYFYANQTHMFFLYF
jgi:hypothetical protein